MKYYAELVAIISDRSSSSKESSLAITNATPAIHFIDCATSYRYPIGPAAMKSVVSKNLTQPATAPTPIRAGETLTLHFS